MEPNFSVTYPFECGEGYDYLHKRAQFWDAPNTKNWFKERGYTLYKRFYDGNDPIASQTIPALPFEEFSEGEYPYAYYDTEILDEYGVPLRSYATEANVAFAQDVLGRHVAIKIARNDTDEYRISRFLSQQNLETLKDNCIIPVLDLLPMEDFWFIVMPRWGSKVDCPSICEVRDALHFIHSMLKALSFLHEHDICHGDIKFSNMLVNHFTDAAQTCDINIREDLRSKGSILYVMFDFDYSIMLPSGTDRTKYRLPSHRSWGTFNPTMDTAQGEFDFNPFVLDVGALGVLLSYRFQRFSRQLPLLAPLLDKMTTRHLHNRFTATEALRFFNDMYSRMTQDEIDEPLVVDAEDMTHNRGKYFEFDKWKKVPSDFAEKWVAFRELPVPWTTKVLRRLCQNVWIYHVVAHIRWLFFHLSSYHRRLHTHFLGLRITN